MVGRFAGWLIYIPGLPNWVSMLHNSTGGPSTTSFTLQDHNFPWLGFQYAENVHHTQFGQFCIQVST